jgi:DNA polymerase III sliding clamp (beta) subunit (PCNA family)
MEIQSNLIRAAAECATENNVRSYLNGVCIEYTASDNRVWIVGTNEHILFAAWQAVDPVNESFKVLIPTKMASKIKSKSIDVNPDGTVTTFFDGTAGSFKADTIKHYPDWRYVVPKQVKNEHQIYANIYLVKAAKVFDLVAGRRGKTGHVDVRGGDDEPGIVQGLPAHCIMVMMPIRLDKEAPILDGLHERLGI